MPCSRSQVENGVDLTVKAASALREISAGTQVTLTEIREVITMILTYERQARQALLKERRQAEQDRVARAIGTLSSATMITSEETMELLSAVRLGIHLNLIDLPPTTVNQLFIHTQAAHLQKLTGQQLDGEERNAARAKYLKSRLRDLGANK